MSARTTFVLMLVFLTLGSFAFFDPFGLKGKRQESTERASHPLWLEGKKLETLTVKSRGETLVFECAKAEGCPTDGSAEWKLISPVQDLADNAVLGSLTATLKGLTHVDKLDFDADFDPHEFGFPETNVSVDLKAKGEGNSVLLRVGKAAPVGANIYVTTSEAPRTVFLVPSTVAGMLQQDLFHWRNKRLFPGTKVEAVSFLFWNTKDLAVAANRAQKGWELSKPIAGPAGGVMLEGLGSTLVYASAKSIFASDAQEPKAKAALAGKPSMEIRFGAAEDQAATLKLYPSPAGKGELLALASGLKPVFSVEASQFDRFRKDLSAYRDRRLFPGQELFSVNKMELKFPRAKQAITLARQGDAWVQAGGDATAEPLSRERIGALFEKLNNAEAQDFVPAASPAGLAFAREPSDVEISLSENEKLIAQASFLVHERKFAVTAGASPKEVRRFGEDFLKVLPLRLAHLYASSNQPVVTEKEDAHGHDHSHGGAH